MINWTEEDIKFIMQTMILPSVEEFAKLKQTEIDVYWESIEKIINRLANRLNELDYNRERDRRYFMAFLSQKLGYDQASMESSYQQWCEEFYKLNKHLLEGKKDDGHN